MTFLMIMIKCGLIFVDHFHSAMSVSECPLGGLVMEKTGLRCQLPKKEQKHVVPVEA